MGRVFIEDLICEGEKKLVKVVDEGNPVNFSLANGSGIKHFHSGYDKFGYSFKYDLFGLFNGGFIISKIVENRTTEVSAYNYQLNKIASAESYSILYNLTNNEAFSKFVRENSLNKECEEISK
ncbi:MAG: hypothetical protein K6F08_03640 [bacterium]|nr:hypothetical protein [bacterium]